MKNIRQGVFETNSSSTHSICIARVQDIELPESIHFKFGEFGWEVDTLKTNEEKASYLYTGLIANERRDDFNTIVALLKSKGVDVTFEDKSSNRYHDEGYVDHSGELTEFLDSICNDETKLLSYLFSDLSFIKTGNDNDDCDVSIDVDYPHDEYFKGN